MSWSRNRTAFCWRSEKEPYRNLPNCGTDFRRRENMIGGLWQDLRYAVRNLRKHALLSFTVIATLTLGMGMSTSVFTLFNADALRPPMDKDFDSFVRVY